MKSDQLIPNRALKNLITEWNTNTGIFAHTQPLQSSTQLMTTTTTNSRQQGQPTDLFAAVPNSQILNHYQMMESLARTIGVEFKQVYTGVVVEQSLVAFAGIYTEQTNSYYRRELDTTTYFQLKFKSMNEWQIFVARYDSKFPGFIKTKGAYNDNQLTKIVVDTKRLYEEVAMSLGELHKNSHINLMKELAAKLNANYNEVLTGIFAAQSLVAKTGISTLQENAQLSRTGTYSTRFSLKFASQQEYQTFASYYDQNYPNLIISAGDYNPSGLTTVELNTNRLIAIAESLKAGT
jgi:hypothetical protein